MCENRLLLLDVKPGQQVHGFCFGVVVSGHLFAEHGYEESAQVEVTRDQAEFLQDSR